MTMQLFHPDDGRLLFDSDTSTVTHIRGSFTTTDRQAGSIVIPGISAVGIPFVLSAVPLPNTGAAVIFPEFSFAGDRVSWTTGHPCRVVVASHS